MVEMAASELNGESSGRALEAVIAVDAERRAADQLRTVQGLLDRAMGAANLSAADCALLARTALALHERLDLRAKRLSAPVVAPLKPGRR